MFEGGECAGGFQYICSNVIEGVQRYRYTLHSSRLSLIVSQHTGLGVLDKTYSAKPAQRSNHAVPPLGYIGWTGHGSSLCRLAGLDGNSAEQS
jgi:hypothetical protein